MALRHPAEKASRSASRSSKSKSRDARANELARAARYAVESLEDRVLLTVVTLHGGDSFSFVNESGTAPNVNQTISAIGNITATLVSANFDATDTVQLIDPPGLLNGLAVNGGPQLQTAATPIGTIQIAGLPPGVSVAVPPTALAVNPANGNMYAIVVASVPPPAMPPGMMGSSAVFVVQLTKNPVNGVNPGTVLTNLGPTPAPASPGFAGDISGGILSGAGVPVGAMGALVTSVTAACFGPNGNLYFIATTGGATAGSGSGAGGTDALYTINLGLANAIPQRVGNFFTGGNVTAIAYGGAGSQTFYIAEGSAIFSISSINNQPPNPLNNMGNGSITGMAFAPDPQTGQVHLYIIDNKEVWIVDTPTGIVTDYGPLSGPGGLKSAGNLAYDPTTGVAFTTDLINNQLDAVSLQYRIRHLSIFQVYISQSDATGVIETQSSGTGTVFYPFGTGLVTGIRANREPPGLTPAPAGIGDAVIGARTAVVNNAFPQQGGIPVLSGSITTQSTFGAANYTVGSNISAGIVAAPGTNIGKILIGGPVFGEVKLMGSIDTFYAGWIATGDATNSLIAYPQNFYVAGDLRNLITPTDIGDDELAPLPYTTGFDLYVGGTLGQVRVNGNVEGNIVVAGSPTAPTLMAPGGGIENIQKATGPKQQNTIPPYAPSWDAGDLNGDTVLFTESFDYPQYVGSIATAVGQAPSQTIIDGTLYTDAVDANFVDYYAVALLAGQTITCKVVSTPTNLLSLGVFNPDGVLVASDYNNVNTGLTNGQFFRFTPDRPGLYRFAVAQVGNTSFTNAGGVPESPPIPYEVTILGTGDIALGAVAALGPQPASIFTATNLNWLYGGDITVNSGDLGGLTTSAVGSVLTGLTTVLNGNLRDMDAGGVGGTATTPGDPLVDVPNGSVGLISSVTYKTIFNVSTPLPPPIGGDYQLVSSSVDMVSDLIANGSIGVIRGAAMTGTSTFWVNASENPATPGNIDLIDDRGDFGNPTSGGPHIITGPGGNVGFLRVGGTTYRDSTFGGGTPEESLYQPGETATLTDDSGATVTIVPTGVPGAASLTGGPSTGGNTTPGTSVNPALPQLLITAYGIEGTPGVNGGGVAIEKIVSTGSVSITGGGSVNGQTIQIGVIDCLGTGQALTTTTVPITTSGTKSQPPVPGVSGSGGTTTNMGFYPPPNTAGPRNRTLPVPPYPSIDTTQPASGQMNLLLMGSARIDAFEVDGGDFTNVTDSTGGAIVNITATSVGALQAGSVGLVQNHTGAALNGLTQVANAFPFIDQRNIVNVPVIATITANSIGNVHVTGSVATLNGSIQGPVEVDGSLYSVVLGQGGVFPSGSGIGSRAGLYVTGFINTITNSVAADIRGTIVSQVGMTSLTLRNGSIINAIVGESAGPAAFSNTNALAGGYELITTPSPFTNPLLDLGSIVVIGNGGIIGSALVAEHLGRLQVQGGFGIIDSITPSVGDGTIETLSATGYGIRGSHFNGSKFSNIFAVGNGSNVSTAMFSPDVRLSETVGFDPYYGFQPNGLTDLDVVLGTTAANPQNTETDTGIIEDSTFTVNRDIGNVRAFAIRSTDPLVPTMFNAANSIGSMLTHGPLTNVQVLTGRIQKFTPGGDLDNTTLTVSGTIRTLVLTGNVIGNSTIVAGGINGVIQNLVVHGNVIGTIKANRKIGSAYITGNLSGTVVAPTITTLKVGGQIANGDLVIQGNIGTLQTTGDLALPGETITVHGSVKAIRIGGNLNANINVTELGGTGLLATSGGTLGLLQVGHSVISGTTTSVANLLDSLVVNGDVQANSTVTAGLIKHRKVKGLVLGTISQSAP